LFRNYDETGTRRPRPRTLLIDSEQIESGDALDKTFREHAKDQIERFRRDIVDRGGTRQEAEGVTDSDLLREAMNTVGKPGRLGEDIRCVVSVAMLTEGWDASTVTHVLGVRAFGTQLLCEQVVGRALRRQSYDLNSVGRFDPEYADVLGVPFDFTAKPTVVPPVKPRKVTHVHAVRPDRDALEIRFPRVGGYRVQLPDERLTATFSPDSTLILTPENVGPAETTNQGIVGLPEELRPDRNRDIRTATLAFHLAWDLLRRHLRDRNEEPKLQLFGAVKRIVTQWLEGGYLVCQRGTHRGQVLYEVIAEKACERIYNAISARLGGERRVLAVTDPYNVEGSTADVNYRTAKTTLWRTDEQRCHVNWAVCDLSWEMEFCRVAEAEPGVEAYVKNAGLGFEVPYRFGGESHRYLPDFIVLVRDGAGEPVHLVVEIKGQPDEQSKAKSETMRGQWIPGVNNLGEFGRWEFLELRDINTMAADFATFVRRIARLTEAA
ncbi:MAG: restriction endonuclease, partial [Rhodospirillales bacterium]|nr:restriction endonuclease [Rhodospirillales bacterium]